MSACGSDAASSGTLSASGAWARSTPPGAVNGVVYLTITSPHDNAIVDVDVPASVAASAELHETMTTGAGAAMPNMPNMSTGGEMTMTPVDSIALSAGGAVEFAPGGKHIMLVDIASPLVVGQHFTVTLGLADGASLPVDVVVADNAP